MATNNQAIQSDDGKPQLTLSPLYILTSNARVREYAITKYGRDGIEAWHSISTERLQNALMRHLVAYIEDPNGVDEESGLPHLWHVGINVTFLIEKERGNKFEA